MLSRNGGGLAFQHRNLLNLEKHPELNARLWVIWGVFLYKKS
jgi:hypothetical protein